MGQRTQIYVRIENKLFLQYHGQWGAAYPLLRGVKNILQNLQDQEVTKNLQEISEKIGNDFNYHKTNANQYPIKSVMGLTIHEKLIHDMEKTEENTDCNFFNLENIVSASSNDHFENLFYTSQKLDGTDYLAIRILGDNNNGGALIDIVDGHAKLYFFDMIELKKAYDYYDNLLKTLEESDISLFDSPEHKEQRIKDLKKERSEVTNVNYLKGNVIPMELYQESYKEWWSGAYPQNLQEKTMQDIKNICASKSFNIL